MSIDRSMEFPLGARIVGDTTQFAVRSSAADRVTLCLFDGERERQFPMQRAGDVHVAEISGLTAGQRYGLRASGPWIPESGLYFDESKLLVDPYAKELDGPFIFDPWLSVRGENTTALVPKALTVASANSAPLRPPRFKPGGFIYEINVKGFTVNHPDIPPQQRGTIAALGHPAVIAHLKKLRVDAIELMPIVAWIDERHLAPLRLSNAWGYNPVALMALEPRLAPGGVKELRDTVALLHQSGIGVLLDLVFNHTGESDALGPILSLRGLDGGCYARSGDGSLINDTGTGNTLNGANPAVRTLIMDTLRHFVMSAGIDGFRFDLATVMARGPAYDRNAPIFAAIAGDPILSDRIMIAEPWDIGPSGYQLGNFPNGWLEWNDRYRDDVRKFWRGDARAAGPLATRITGSSDVFAGTATRSVNYIASHDGFALVDVVSYATRHNEANGEDNRDGQAENFSWNYGVEGPSEDPAVLSRRHLDVVAFLTTLFISKGTILLTAGDEFGRTQAGNNNAYAQDNSITWLNWADRDQQLENFVAKLSLFRNEIPEIGDPAFLHEADWRSLDGDPMTPALWNADQTQGFELRLPVRGNYTVIVRADRRARSCTLSLQGPGGSISVG